MPNYMIVRQRVTNLTRFQTTKLPGLPILANFVRLTNLTSSSSSWKSRYFPREGILAF